MNLSIKELNDLYYCVCKVKMLNEVKMIENEVLNKLIKRLSDEIDSELLKDEDEYIENIV
jgi:hypothetical protein